MKSTSEILQQFSPTSNQLKSYEKILVIHSPITAPAAEYDNALHVDLVYDCRPCSVRHGLCNSHSFETCRASEKPVLR